MLTQPLTVMSQNLRLTPCDPRCPEQWEVPIQCGNVVAMVYGSTASSSEESKAECLERARLFAVAPDLLAELKRLHKIHEPFGDPNHCAVCNLISRAEGRT